MLLFWQRSHIVDGFSLRRPWQLCQQYELLLDHRATRRRFGDVDLHHTPAGKLLPLRHDPGLCVRRHQLCGHNHALGLKAVKHSCLADVGHGCDEGRFYHRLERYGRRIRRPLHLVHGPRGRAPLHRQGRFIYVVFGHHQRQPLQQLHDLPLDHRAPRRRINHPPFQHAQHPGRPRPCHSLRLPCTAVQPEAGPRHPVERLHPAPRRHYFDLGSDDAILHLGRQRHRPRLRGLLDLVLRARLPILGRRAHRRHGLHHRRRRLLRQRGELLVDHRARRLRRACDAHLR
mmetsp:Transcript_55040/g.145319  ORF Transcript_55040/g.145319 Transcript_55040/m.145319 type:complete len:287 (+) Transcript_55040:185-1045(+)